jgi:hypothetical protein
MIKKVKTKHEECICRDSLQFGCEPIQLWKSTGYKLIITKWSGRLGNNLIQLCRALFIAKKTQSVLYYPNHRFIENVVFDFRKRNISLRQQKCDKTITGTFFGQDILHNLKKKYTDKEQVKISQKYIYPLLNILPKNKWTIASPKNQFNSTLVIHIRGGDAMRVNAHKLYAQPPLAVYKKIILNSEIKFTNVLIVTEKDRRNPCIKGIKSFCKSINLKCYVQSSNLQTDVSTMIRARYFVTAQSSLSHTLLRCNKHCKIAYIPFIRICETEIFPKTVSKLPYKQRYYGLPEYTCAKEWAYSPKQLRLMLSYPMRKIKLRKVPSSPLY